MTNNIRIADDYVINAMDERDIRNYPKARQDAVIRSMVLSELAGIAHREELPFETVLDKIETVDAGGWESTLQWLGHFFAWESCRDEWEFKSPEYIQ